MSELADRRPSPVGNRATHLVKIETFQVAPRWLFVKIEDESGFVGWGEASLEGNPEAVVGVFESFRDRFMGADSNRIEHFWQVAYRGGFYRGGPVLMSALSGLDQALWDLKGKRYGLPVWELLGGMVREKVQAYGWIGGDRPAEVAAAAKERKADGFNFVKMNAAGEMGHLSSTKSLAEIIERVAAVRAEGLEVGIDFHGRVHRTTAKRLLALLEPLAPAFVEEPVTSEHPEALREVAEHTSIPIALGERLYSRWDFKTFLHQGTVDILQPDLSHAGGISEVRRIAAQAEAYDVAVAPHCPLGPLALASCLQVAGCSPNVVLQEMSLGIHYNEHSDLHTYLRDAQPLLPKDGFLKIPLDPGLGIELDEDKVREAAQTPPRWRNPIWTFEDGSFAEW